MAFVDLGAVGSGALTLALVLSVIVFTGGIIFFIVWIVKKQKQYSGYKIVVYEKDSFGKVHEWYDRGGVFVDPTTNKKLLFLKKGNVGLSCDAIPYVPGPKDQKIVYLFKYGEKNYRFVRLEAPTQKLEFVVGDEDVNWAANSFIKAVKYFNKESFFDKWGAPLLMMLGMMILAFIFIYFFKKLDALQTFGGSIDSASQHIENTVKMALAGVNNSTVILQ